MELTSELEAILIKKERNNIIAVTGGGGKSTLLSLFGRFLADKGMSVLITTTTRVQNPVNHDWKADRVFLSREEIEKAEPVKGKMDFYAERNSENENKVRSPELHVLGMLSMRYDVTLYEADGSRSLPLKIHSSRDPVVLEGTTGLVAIMGAWGMGEKIADVTFGDRSDGIVDKCYMQKYFTDPEGLLKGAEGKMERLIIVNRYETIDDEKKRMLSEVVWPCTTYFASERENEAYKRIS